MLPSELARIPFHHTYPLGCITLFLTMVLSAATSLRGASRVLEVLSTALNLSLPYPTWFTGRLWLLRLGYYQLTCPKEQADDWVWIVDHTIQLGPEKCLVILGVRLSHLPPGEQCLKHTDVELLDLVPVQHSNGTVVYEQLEKVVAKTGVPREIISDHGSDLKVGAEKFCQLHPQTSAIYDIKHKTAAVLKQELEHDESWVQFIQLANHTKQQIQQTALAGWAPPNQKAKARYLNVDALVTWGQRLLALLDQPQAVAATGESEQVREKLGWVTRFRPSLTEWAELFELIAATESMVRHAGLYREAPRELEQRLQPLARTARSQRVSRELIAFVTEQAAQAHPNERLLGSSEVIESVLGKMKRLERDQSTGGFTGLVLGIGALVSKTTEAIIQKAMETVSTQQVWTWCQETLGRSVQSKRRKLFVLLNDAEQKRDQLPETT